MSELLFLIKKILGSLLQPLSLILLSGFFGLFLLHTRRQILGRVLLSLSLLSLLLLSYAPIAHTISRGLEKQYTPYVLKPAFKPKYVIVLGGGVVMDPTFPITSQIGSVSLARLVEGIRIFRKHPDSTLLLSGGGTLAGQQRAEAAVMAEMAQLLGVPVGSILTESKSWDTKDQARRLKRIVADAPFVLVTSATHLPRAMLMFQEEGMKPVPGPAKFHSKDDEETVFNRHTLFPRPQNLVHVSRSVHEYLGLLWMQVTLYFNSLNIR